MLCQECKKRDDCVALCAKAEKYSYQDWVYNREVYASEDTLDWIHLHISRHTWPEMATYFQENKVCFPFLSDVQNKCLSLFYFKGLTYKQIASRLSSANQHGVFLQLSSEAVSYQIRSAKRDILQFLTISRGMK